METANLIQKLRKINRKYAFNIFRVRIGGLYMALFFLILTRGVKNTQKNYAKKIFMTQITTIV